MIDTAKLSREISIHALRGEGDILVRDFSSDFGEFQSTPSVGRATLLLKYIDVWISIFQSTPSVGRATKKSCFSTTG